MDKLLFFKQIVTHQTNFFLIKFFGIKYTNSTFNPTMLY